VGLDIKEDGERGGTMDCMNLQNDMYYNDSKNSREQEDCAIEGEDNIVKCLKMFAAFGKL
jgi:hypothetical protein